MRKQALYKLLLAAFFIIPFGRESYGQPAKAETEIREMMKELDVVGLSVAVVKKGKIIYNNAFGLKDVAANEPLANNDIFRIASISKSFSATAIMQLMDAGKLSLDDDFSKLVGFTVRNPKFPETVITLRMVMSHTASINDSQGYFTLDASLFATIYDYDSTKKLVPSPGAYNPRREEIRNYVMGYSTPIFSPTGGMKISAADLARYMTMHMQHGKYKGVRIISKKSSRIMQTTVAEKEGYALAIMHTDKLIPGKMLTGHTGSAYGLYSAMFFDPKKKFGIVVITNGCNPVYKDGYNQVIKRAVNILYEDIIQ